MLFLPAKETLYRALYGGSVDDASRDMVNRYALKKGGMALREECPREPTDVIRSMQTVMDYMRQDAELTRINAFLNTVIYGREILVSDYRGRIYGRRADVIVADDLEAA